MEKANWKDDTFLRVSLSDTAKAPTIPPHKFEKKVNFVVKPKRGLVYIRTCPEWAKDIVENLIKNDENTNRYFIKE